MTMSASGWTAGYVADICYTFGYYRELNPLRVKLAFLNAGLVYPEIGVACELGFGQGLSANMHAAGSVTQWTGTDFNPAQAGLAQEFAAVSGTNARLYDEAFADFANRADLPDFDYIGVHGIWSWISDENRKVMVDFLRKKLKVGGVLYISYNTLPGWAAFAPMRHLLTEHADVIGSEGHGIVSRIDGALDFAEELLATNPAYACANPDIAERIGRIKNQSRHYLAHEYFNRDWHPMHFGTMADWLEPAKLNYACSAYYLDHIDNVNLTNEQQAFLGKIPNVMFRETVRDFMVNQQFRKDYWVKGARKLNDLEQTEALRAQQVILITHRPDVMLEVTGAKGTSIMSEEIYGPILDVLADHQVKTLGEIEQAVKGRGVTFWQLIEATMVLTGADHLAAVQDAGLTKKAKQHTDKLNAHLMDKARGCGDIGYLASPVTGGGVTVGRFQQMFLLAMRQGKEQPADWAQFVWQQLDSQDHKVVKDGERLETVEENLAELTAQALAFAKERLHILQALQIA